MASFLFFTTFFLVSSSSVLCAVSISSSKVQLSEEKLLPSFQKTTLATDFPVRSLVLDGREALWILGKKFLWQWKLQENLLQKVVLPHKPQKEENSGEETVDKLVSIEDKLYLASNRSLLEISFTPLHVVKFLIPGDAQAFTTLEIQTEGDAIYWLKQNALYRISKSKQEIKVFKDHLNMSVAAKASYLIQQQIIIVVDEKDVWFYSCKKTPCEVKKILHSKFPFTHLQKWESDYFIHTPYSVLRMQKDGTIFQTIPVEGERQLIASDFEKDFHLFLFKDSILQVNSLLLRESWYFQLNHLNLKYISELKFSEDMLAFIDSGEPRVFQLPYKKFSKTGSEKTNEE